MIFSRPPRLSPAPSPTVVALVDHTSLPPTPRNVQVLATVISQAKLVVSEILEPSDRNEYAHAMAALPAVQDLCFSVFGNGGGRVGPAPHAAAAAAAVVRPDATGAAAAAGAGCLSEMPPAGVYPGGCVSNGGSGDGREAGGPPRAARQRAR